MVGWLATGSGRCGRGLDVGVVLLDAPPTIGNKIQRAGDETDHDLLLENNSA